MTLGSGFQLSSYYLDSYLGKQDPKSTLVSLQSKENQASDLKEMHGNYRETWYKDPWTHYDTLVKCSEVNSDAEEVMPLTSFHERLL